MIRGDEKTKKRKRSESSRRFCSPVSFEPLNQIMKEQEVSFVQKYLVNGWTE